MNNKQTFINTHIIYIYEEKSPHQWMERQNHRNEIWTAVHTEEQTEDNPKAG